MNLQSKYIEDENGVKFAPISTPNAVRWPNGDNLNDKLKQADWNESDTTDPAFIKNKPTIPSALDLTNYVQKSSTSGLLKNDGTVDTSTYIETPVVDANNHNYVDLGLTSGTLWATMNIGSFSEADNGDYYQYGKGSSLYEDTYQQSVYAGAEDPLSLSVDTARQVWGGDWHIPTKEQWQELIDECTWTYTTIGNKNGYRVSKNNKSIFLPASGYCSNGSLNITGSYARYLSSTSFIFDNNLNAYGLEFDDSNKSISEYGLATGTPIRGVLDHAPTQAFKVSVTGSYNDLTDKPTIPDISGKANSADLATVATSGSYTDLSNTPTIPDAQIQSDWNLTDNSSKDYIKNKPQVSDGKTRSPGLSFEPPAETGTNYTYVDLGLPSGTLWATKNVGASDLYDDGLYFSWGNIEGYANPSTSIFSLSNYESSIAYTLNSSIQPTTSFDAAKYNMGDPWRMPTRAEVLELIDNTDITWVANQYVKFAKKTDNSVYIIIPNHRDNEHSYAASYTDALRYAGFLCSDYKYESPGKHYGSRACFVNNNYPDDTDYHLALAVWYYLKTPGFPVRGVQNPNDTNQIEPANYKQISAAKVAVTGSYDDLTNKPTIPQIWSGTQAQYDLLTPDNNTIYIITSAS